MDRKDKRPHKKKNGKPNLIPTGKVFREQNMKRTTVRRGEDS